MHYYQHTNGHVIQVKTKFGANKGDFQYKTGANFIKYNGSHYNPDHVYPAGPSQKRGMNMGGYYKTYSNNYFTKNGIAPPSNNAATQSNNIDGNNNNQQSNNGGGQQSNDGSNNHGQASNNGDGL